MTLFTSLRKIISGLISNSSSKPKEGRRKLNYPLPYVMSDELEVMERILEELKPKRCLEWGAGGSTLYFPRNHEFIELWLSLEHDKEWYEKLKSKVPTNVELVLAKNVEEYILYPVHKGKFNFIFVDGKWRLLCMYVASKILDENGVCLLHDSSRPQYRPAINFFPYCKKLTEGTGKSDGLHAFWNGDPPINLKKL